MENPKRTRDTRDKEEEEYEDQGPSKRERVQKDTEAATLNTMLPPRTAQTPPNNDPESRRQKRKELEETQGDIFQAMVEGGEEAATKKYPVAVLLNWTGNYQDLLNTTPKTGFDTSLSKVSKEGKYTIAVYATQEQATQARMKLESGNHEVAPINALQLRDINIDRKNTVYISAFPLNLPLTETILKQFNKPMRDIYLPDSGGLIVNFLQTEDMEAALKKETLTIKNTPLSLQMSFGNSAQVVGWIGFLPSYVNEKTLGEQMTAKGLTFARIEIKRDPESNESRGFGYVTFKSREQLVSAMLVSFNYPERKRPALISLKKDRPKSYGDE